VHTGTVNTQAYEAYLKGRYLFKRNPDNIEIQEQAEQFFQRALDIDPGFTLALFGQFDVLNFRQRSGNMEYKEGAVRLRQLADKMIAMDPDLPESQIVRGRVAMIERNWSEAETALNQALVLNPGNINVFDILSSLMWVLDKTDKALEYALKAEARDPLDIRSLLNLERAHTSNGQCIEAENAARRALELVPESNRVNFVLGNCWMTVHGDYQKAIDLFNKEGLGFQRHTGLAIAYNKLGQQDKAQAALDALIENDGVQASYQYGQIYSQWGEKERALDALEKAWSIGDAGFILLNMDKFLIPLREEPRFIALMEKWRNPSSN
jgi:tetratricopeptide (TPR) repeat protein